MDTVTVTIHTGGDTPLLVVASTTDDRVQEMDGWDDEDAAWAWVAEMERAGRFTVVESILS